MSMKSNKKKSMVILVIGIIIVLISVCFFRGERKIANNQIERNDYGAGDEEVSLLVLSEYGKTELDYSIKERIYSEQEIAGLLQNFIAEAEKEVLGGNEDADTVCLDLNFVSQLEGYPFTVSWSVSDTDYISSRGIIKKDVEEKHPIILTAKIEYEDFATEHSFPIVLVPKENTPQEIWKKELVTALDHAQEDSRENAYLTLPDEVNGSSLVWQEKRENKGIIIGGFCIVIGILLLCSERIEKREQDKKRLTEIRKEYPEFVLKYSMLIGAGLTLRQTFEKIAATYKSVSGRKKILYEELLISVRELANGVPERQVYESFGRRCGIGETIKFGSLISRNLRKGTDGLKGALREEAMEAIEMQKEQIKRQGETAGTKLLFPMLILLLIVMVIIMVPAFSTFSI